MNHDDSTTIPAVDETADLHPSGLTIDELLELAREIAKLSDEDREQVEAILRRSQMPHPEWCTTDLVDADGEVHTHLGEGFGTVRSTSDSPKFTVRLEAFADSQEPRGYGSSHLEMTIDPGDESNQQAITVQVNTLTSEVLSALSQDLLRQALEDDEIWPLAPVVEP